MAILNNKTLLIGDLHFKDSLSYSEYIENGRKEEEQEILDFIVEQAKTCDKVVFLGDIFNAKNNSSSVVKKAVKFIESFTGKQIYILSGNHDKMGDGRTAIDFLSEVKNANWHIIVNEVLQIKDYTFCPFFNNAQLEAEDNKDAVKKIMKKLEPNKVLFVHHSISGSSLPSGISVNNLPEAVLPKKELEKKFDLIFGGHIHKPQQDGKVTVTGSVFNQETGEKEKFIYRLDDKMKVEKVALPGRGIYKLEDPTDEDLKAIPKNSIVKTILTEKLSSIKIGELKKKLDNFDASVLLEQIPHKRKKIHLEDGKSMLEMSVQELLGLYAKEKKVNLIKLLKGFELIKL